MSLAGSQPSTADADVPALVLPYLPDTAAQVQPGDDAFRWPVSFPAIAPQLEDIPTRFLTLADGIQDDETRYVLLGSISFLVATLAYAEAAIYLQAGSEQHVDFEALPEAGRYLAGRTAEDDLPVPFSTTATAIGSAPSLPWLRECKITAQWNGAKALQALIRPEIVTISTNELVKQAAISERRPIRYRFQWEVFKAPREAGPAYRIDCMALARRTADVLVDGIDGVSGDHRERLRRLVRHEAEVAFTATAGHLNRLSGLHGLPDELWSGTGGHWPSRLIGLEVMRRGGAVRRFGHGLNAGIFYQRQKPFRTTEFAVSTQYTVPTRSFAELMQRTSVDSGMPPRFRPQVLWGQGDEHPLERPVRPAARAAGGRTRVLYAPTVPRGVRQYLSPQLPDVLYRNWQYRLVSVLRTLPIDLVCTLHPRERALAEAHPCANAGTVTDRGFEQEIGEADVVLFDYLKSTTVAAALLTTVPVVYVDLEGLAFEPEIFAELERRCTVIKAEYDAAGRPTIDADQLGDALCSRHAEPDSDYFRRLYAEGPA